jgi:hypothetical protein
MLFLGNIQARFLEPKRGGRHHSEHSETAGSSESKNPDDDGRGGGREAQSSGNGSQGFGQAWPGPDVGRA